MFQYFRRFIRKCRMLLRDEWERKYSTWRRWWFVVSFQWNKMYAADKRQIVAILTMLIFVLILLKVIPERNTRDYTDQALNKAVAQWSQQQQQDSVRYRRKLEARFQSVRAEFRIQDSLRRQSWKKTSSTKKRIHPLRLVHFDPNKVDSASLVQMGLSQWMSSNLVKYRKAGKIFGKAEDLRVLFGMSTNLYDSLSAYVCIDTTYVRKKREMRRQALRDSNQMWIPRDTVGHKVDVIKLVPGEHVELNSADTSQLKRIPGVGSRIAKRLVRYRKQLGGYVSVHQVRDIYINDSLLNQWVILDPSLVHTLSVNHSTVMLLKKHPYCTYIQAKAIVQYRVRYGTIHNIQELQYVDGMTKPMVQRLAPYLDFNP